MTPGSGFALVPTRIRHLLLLSLRNLFPAFDGLPNFLVGVCPSDFRAAETVHHARVRVVPLAETQALDAAIVPAVYLH